MVVWLGRFVFSLFALASFASSRARLLRSDSSARRDGGYVWWYSPGAHISWTHADASWEGVLPHVDGQSMHPLAPAAPWYVPAAQGWHTPAACALNVPAAHGEHDCCLADAWCQPAGQSAHTLGLWKRPAEQMQPPLQDPHLDMQVEQLVWSEPPGWHRRRLCGSLPPSLRSLRRESSFRSTPRSGRDAFTARPADGGVRRPWW